MGFSIFNSKTPEEIFWKWFKKNENMLYEFEKDREKVFDKLSNELRKLHSDLTFEFGPIEDDGKREFTISAGGFKDAFSNVELLYNSKPDLDKWNVLKFRQRHNELCDISFGETSIKAKDVFVLLCEDEDKIGLVLFMDDYNDNEKTKFAAFGFLYLDQALGEYDVVTKVGVIEFKNKQSELFVNAFPITDLAVEFDKFHN